MSKYIYNFPISMLHGFMVNTDSVLDEILDFCIWQKYQKCEDIEEVKQTLCISFGNENMVLEKGRKLFERYRNDGYPWTGISHDAFWSFFRQNRSDFDKATLLAFLAIKSFIGQKEYYKITNQKNIFKRMAGYKESDKYHLPKEIKKFTTRSRFDRIKLELQENWNIVIYAFHVRGMYVSSVLSLNQLALVAEKNKLKTRQKKKSYAAAEARKKALEVIARETTEKAEEEPIQRTGSLSNSDSEFLEKPPF